MARVAETKFARETLFRIQKPFSYAGNVFRATSIEQRDNGKVLVTGSCAVGRSYGARSAEYGVELEVHANTPVQALVDAGINLDALNIYLAARKARLEEHEARSAAQEQDRIAKELLRDAMPNLVKALQAENARHKLHIKHIGNDALRSENAELNARLAAIEAQEPVGWVRTAAEGPGVYDPLFLVGVTRPSGYASGYKPTYTASGASPQPEQPSQAPTCDLRGIDAGPLSEWVDLVKHGYVAKDECLIAVKDVPKWVAKNATQPAIDHRGEIIDVLCDDAFGENYKSLQTDITDEQGRAMTYWGGKAIRQTIAQPVQPSPARELSDEDLQPAVDAWFNEYIHAGRYPFAKRMRAAIAAINAKKN